MTTHLTSTEIERIDSWIASELTRLGLADEFEDGVRDEQLKAIHDAL